MDDSIRANVIKIAKMALRRRWLLVIPALIMVPMSILAAIFIPGGYTTHSILMLQENVQPNPLAIEKLQPSREVASDMLRSMRGLLVSDMVLGPVVVAQKGRTIDAKARAIEVADLARRARVELVGNGVLRFELDGGSPRGLGRELESIIASFFDVLMFPPMDSTGSVVIKDIREKIAAVEAETAATEKALSRILPEGQAAIQASLETLRVKRKELTISATKESQGVEQQKALDQQIAVLEKRYAGAAATIVRLEDLTSQRATLNQRLGALRSRLGSENWQPLQPLLNSPQHIVVIDPPQDPVQRTRSRIGFLIAGILGGIALGILLAAIAEIMDPPNEIDTANPVALAAGTGAAVVHSEQSGNLDEAPPQRPKPAVLATTRRTLPLIALFLSSLAMEYGVWTSPAYATTDPVQLPEVNLSFAVPPVTGRSIQVMGGGNLQAALDAARPGDAIVLEAGARFVGSFRLRNHPGNGWITVRSAGLLPPEGTRATAAHAAGMATLMSPGSNQSVLTTEAGAHNYYILGLQITALPSVATLTSLVSLGDGNSEQKTLESQPRDIVIDRSYIHGHPGLNLRRAIALNSASTAIINSTLDEVHHKDSDSQAICGWSGTGPYLIENNKLEGSGENIMFGGGEPSIPGAIPSDITIRRNDITKPDHWRGVWLVKNLLELKLGRRVLIENNLLQNNWTHGQSGVAIVLKTSGEVPWSITTHVTFRKNVVKDSVSAIAISGGNGLPASHFDVYDNTFVNIGGPARPAEGRLVLLLGYGGSLRHVRIANNKAIEGASHPNSIVMFDGEPTYHLTLTGNVFTHGEYGIKGSGTSTGAQTLEKYTRDLVFKDNVFVGGAQGPYGRWANSNKFQITPPAAR